MGFPNRFKIHISILLLILSAGCSSVSLREKLDDSPVVDPVVLQLGGNKGLHDITLFHTNVISQNLSDGELVKKTSEENDFKVRTELVDIDPVASQLAYKVVTLEKAGKADLHEYAIPNLGEEIIFRMSKNGQVLEAGAAPKGSIFFVPPISLPNKPVQKGDTWPLKSNWVSLKTGVPLEMDIVSILSNLKKCGTDLCAVIDVSGGVTIKGLPTNFLSSKEGKEDIQLRFVSKINGQIIFNVNRGVVVYSYVRSEESLNGKTDSVLIQSCIIAKVDEPKEYSVIKSGPLSCNPAASIPNIF
jgi:hypothetical protein